MPLFLKPITRLIEFFNFPPGLIHGYNQIEEGSQYDGYFERMADRICELITPLQRDTILNLKYFLSFDNEIQIHGAEIYEAVIDNGIEDFEELKEWVKKKFERAIFLDSLINFLI